MTCATSLHGQSAILGPLRLHFDLPLGYSPLHPDMWRDSDTPEPKSGVLDSVTDYVVAGRIEKGPALVRC